MQGWEPRHTHTAIRDEAGVLLGWETETEAEWDDEQVAYLIAYRDSIADVGPHGQPMSEATNPLADVNRRGKGWHYEGYHQLDHAEKASTDYRKRLARDFPDGDFDGFVFGVRRVEDE